jgi:hypothetical protein
MDLFRIRAIKNVLENHPLSEMQRKVAICELQKKCNIFLKGAAKREKSEIHNEVEKILEMFKL